MTNRTEIKQFPNKYSPINGAINIVTGQTNAPVQVGLGLLNNFKYIISVTPIIAEYYTQSSVVVKYPYTYKPTTNRFNGNNIIANTNLFAGPLDVSDILKPYVSSNINNLTYSIVKEDNYGIVKYVISEGYQYTPNIEFSSLDILTASNGEQYMRVNSQGVTPSFVAPQTFPGETITLSKSLKNVDSYIDREYVIADITGTGFPTATGFIYIKMSFRNGLGNIIPIYKLPTRSDKGYVTNLTSLLTLANSNTYYAYNGVRQFYDKDKNFADKYLIRDALATSTVPTKALTLYNDYKEIAIDDYEFVNFLMDLSTYPMNNILLITYDINKNIISSASSTVTYLDTVNKYWTGPVGPKNLAAINSTFNTNINAANVVYYEVRFKFVQTTPFPVDNTLMIVKRKINRDCTKYEPVRLAWLNELGGFEFYTFRAGNRHVTNSSKQTYTKSLPYNYTMSDRQDAVYNVKVDETYTANTDYLSEEDYKILESLVSSPVVYYINKQQIGGRYSYGEDIIPSININTYYLPVTITSTSYNSKSIYDGELMQMTIDYKFAFDKNVQREG